jgi:hypothetical protein
MGGKLGKKAARPGAVRFKFTDYVNLNALPRPPQVFGHQGIFGVIPSVGMLGNDKYGDCCEAGAANETILWNAENGRNIAFSDESVLSDYSAITGFNPNDPSTDQGTDMAAIASYRRITGMTDANNNKHKIDAYLALGVGNFLEMVYATYYFNAAGIGFMFPDYAMTQFNSGQPWRLEQGGAIQGGHYVPCVGRDAHNYLICRSWGQDQRMSATFFHALSDEAYAYVSLEALNTAGLSPEGFNRAKLEADLAAL